MKIIPLVAALIAALCVGCPASQAQPSISPADPTSVQRGILSAFKAGAKKVVIPAGIYRLPRPENSPWHLRLEDLKNLEIDATGATFIFEGRDRRAINFNYCENITFRGATLLRETPPFSQGKIVAIAANRDSVDIRVDQGYPTDLDDTRYFPRIPVFNIYQPGTRRLKPLVPDLYLSRLERLSPDTFRFHLRSPLDPRIPLAVGEPAAWRGPSGGDVGMWECAGMKLEDVTLKNGTGLGFQELGGDGGNIYRNVTITYADAPLGATSPPLLACATDGLNSACVRRGPTLENCRFEGLNDDAINIHGFWAMVAQVDGNRVVLDVRPFHGAARTPIPFGRAGDLIRLYDRRGVLSGAAKMVSFRHLTDYKPDDAGWKRSRYFADVSKADYWEVQLDQSVQGEGGGLAANENAVGSGFVIRNCTFRDNRAHGIFIRASNGLIEGNTIERTAMAGILIAPEMFAWNEADYAHNIIIRNNTLRDVGVASQPWNSGITVAAFEHGQFTPAPGGHQNILIAGNTLENVRGANIVVTSANDVQITGNRFISPMSAPAFRIESIGISNDKALVYLRQSTGVQLSANIVSSPGQSFGELVDSDSSVNATGLTSGIAQKN